MYISRLDKRNSQNRLLWEFESDINVIISFIPESYSVDVNIRQCIHVFIDIHFGQFLTYLHICKQRYHLLTLRVNLNHSTCNTSHSKLITRHNSLNLSVFKVYLIECNLNFTTKNLKKNFFFGQTEWRVLNHDFITNQSYVYLPGPALVLLLIACIDKPHTDMQVKQCQELLDSHKYGYSTVLPLSYFRTIYFVRYGS